MKKIYSLLFVLPFLMATPSNAATGNPKPVKATVKHHHHKHHHHHGHSTSTANHMNMCYRETKNPFCAPVVMVKERPCSFGCFFRS